jgi:CHU_C Type IX secretion signal domain/CUB domain
MKQIFTLLIASILSFASFAQAPVNDNCAAAITLTPVGISGICAPDTFTNINATTTSTPGLNPTCWNAGLVSRDVWFQFTVPLGSSGNYTIQASGITITPLRNPQVAIYRGDCLGLDEIYCASSAAGSSTSRVSASALNPGDTYFVRVNDWSTNLTPNSGRFQMCVSETAPIYRMGADTLGTVCNGTLYDSGGPNGQYAVNENRTFKICPATAHQCITITLDSLNTEAGFDFLEIYDGDNITTGIRLDRLSGTAVNSAATPLQYQIRGQCATIRFTSDGSVNAAGFKLTWTCSPTACTTPPPTTCAAPDVVNALPYTASATTCNDLNIIPTTNNCTNNTFQAGRDHLFAYVSQGNECIKINVTGGQPGTGIAVFRNCPTIAGSTCIASVGGGTLINPSVQFVNLATAGTYYISVSRVGTCTPFSILIDTTACRAVLPPNGFCSDALNIAGCSTTNAVNTIQVNTGTSDPNFITNINRGCIIGPQQRYAFFYFRAATSGKFGFLVRAGDTVLHPTGTDIDLSVWGPINNRDSICSFATTRQPIRSSWTGNAGNLGRTGLTDTIPPGATNAGLPVGDTWDCGGGPAVVPPAPANAIVANDMYVRRLDVIAGQYYLVFLDDFSRAINDAGGIAMDFRGTTAGVLSAIDSTGVSRDTFICPGGAAQLRASGGAAYVWSPSVGLNNVNIANPIATPSSTTAYTVRTTATCGIYQQNVNVGVFKINPYNDFTVCIGGQLRFNLSDSLTNLPVGQGVTYRWEAMPGFGTTAELSNTNTRNPIFTAATPGVRRFITSIITPGCTLKDTFDVTVLNFAAPTIGIVANQSICNGYPVTIGTRPNNPSYSYTWSSVPTGFTSSLSNPTVQPNTTTKYILTVLDNTPGGCPAPAIDSVTLRVFNVPIINKARDTIACKDSPIRLANTIRELGITYNWSPSLGIVNGDTTIPSPTTLAPTGTTRYILISNNNGCIKKDTVLVTGVDLRLNLGTGDTLRYCKGTPPISITPTVNPSIYTPVWTSSDRNFVPVTASSITVSPQFNTRYIARVTAGSCTRKDSTLVVVDSIPDQSFTRISPRAQTVCKGLYMVLRSTTYDPIFFPNMTIKWVNYIDTNRVIDRTYNYPSPDSLYNLVFRADTTRHFVRTITNGVCTRKDTSDIIVNPTPVITATPLPANVCIGSSITLRASTNSVITSGFKWTGPGPGAPSNETPTITVSPTTSTSYTVKAFNGQCGDSLVIPVAVQPLPTITFITVRKVLCPGDSVNLNINPGAPLTYRWTGPNGYTSTIANPNVKPTGAGTYVVTITDTRYGCVNKDSVTIFAPTASVTLAGDTVICVGKPLTLVANGTTTLASPTNPPYTWSVSTGAPTGGVSTDGKTYSIANANPSIIVPTTYTYNVIYKYGDICTTGKSINVKFIPNYGVNVSPTDTTIRGMATRGEFIDAGTPVKLNANLTRYIPGLTYTYSWSENGGGISGSDSSNIVTPFTGGGHNYTAKVVSSLGCSNEGSYVFYVREPRYQMPNAFTPNGDKINQYFGPVFYLDEDSTNHRAPNETNPRFWKGRISFESYQVFDRWGNNVYTEANQAVLNGNGYRGWNGKIDGLPTSNEVASDVYVYIIKLRMPDGTLKVESGEINLIR